VSELEPRKRPEKDVAPKHVPQEVVPVAIEDVHEFVHDALRGTSLVDPFANALAGWAVFTPHLRYTPVDPTHTRIEIDVTSNVRGAETLMFVQRRAEIDRFFVALRDELDRRERWKPKPLDNGSSIDSGSPKPEI
jgi:hypothetical protein